MQVPELNRYDLDLDPSGCYLLIKVNWDTSDISATVMNADHLSIETFTGKQCQDIYHAILSHPDADKWFQSRTHIAYLGKELKKAEIALALGSSYYQE